MEKKSNTLSILSLILGILGLLTICIVVGILPCIASLVLGIIALANKQNKPMAIIGIVTSFLGIAFVSLVLLLPSGESAEVDSEQANTNIAEYNNCTIELLNSSMEVSDNGSAVLRVNATYSNNNSDPLYALCSFNVTAFQNDIELVDMSDINGTEDVLIKEIKNGAKVQISYVFELNGSSPVEVIVRTPTADTLPLATMKYELDFEEQTEVSQPKITIENSVIYEGNGVTITAKKFNNGSNPSIDFLIENNSSLNLGINAHAYAVNKIMANDNIYSMDYDIVSGKKANATLEIDKEFLSDTDIDVIETIDILFWFYDNDKSFKEFDTGVISLTTSAYNDPISLSAGDMLYDENGISVYYICTRPDDVTYLVENRTGNYIDFDVKNISINDYTSSDIDYDLMGVVLFNDCYTFIKYKPSGEFLYNNDIEQIDKIDFNLSIRVEEDCFQESLTGLITHNIEY